MGRLSCRGGRKRGLHTGLRGAERGLSGGTSWSGPPKQGRGAGSPQPSFWVAFLQKPRLSKGGAPAQGRRASEWQTWGCSGPGVLRRRECNRMWLGAPWQGRGGSCNGCGGGSTAGCSQPPAPGSYTPPPKTPSGISSQDGGLPKQGRDTWCRAGSRPGSLQPGTAQAATLGPASRAPSPCAGSQASWPKSLQLENRDKGPRETGMGSETTKS